MSKNKELAKQLKEMELLQPVEVAKIFRCSPEKIRRLLRNKILPGYKIKDNWLIEPKEVKKYLEESHSGASDKH